MRGTEESRGAGDDRVWQRIRLRLKVPATQTSPVPSLARHSGVSRTRVLERHRWRAGVLLVVIALLAGLSPLVPAAAAGSSVPKVVLDADFGYATAHFPGQDFNSFPINLSIAQGV